MLHHFLETNNLGDANLYFHAKNCSGQNKNRYVMQYLAWRVLVGLNKKITLSLIVGHIRRTGDLASLSSCTAAQRHRKSGRRLCCGQPRSTHRQAGRHSPGAHVWLGCLLRWALLSNSVERHQDNAPLDFFRRYSRLGCCQGHGNQSWKLMKESTWRPTADTLPSLIPPPGLSLKHRQYL